MLDSQHFPSQIATDKRPLPAVPVPMTRILIADGNDVVREIAQTAHRVKPRLTVCGEAIDGEDAQRKLRELRPDLIILDLAMSGLNGLLAAREISKFRRVSQSCSQP